MGLALCALVLLSSAAHAGMTTPQLRSFFPPGAKAGTTVEVDLNGRELQEPTKLYFSHPKITAEFIPPDEKNKNRPPKFKVTVPADVPVGDYDVRLICKAGITNPRMFCVSDVEEVLEKEPNDKQAEAGRINMNATLNGMVNKVEDVDWYVFSAKAGQRVLIEMRAWRIDSRLDGFMWLYNAEGKQLAMSQDEDARDEKRDPLIDFDVPADGDYFVKLTDFTYNGNHEYFYRLSVSMLPYIDFILPNGAAPGTKVPVTFYGRNLPGGEKTDLTINGRPLQKVVREIETPKDERATEMRLNELVRPWMTNIDGMEVRIKGDAGMSNARLLVFDALPQVAEAEPNDTKEQAQRLNVPTTVYGQFMKGDADWYVIAAKKGEKFNFEVIASRLGSPADVDMELVKKDDNVIANPQDNNENIGQIRFTSNTRDISHNFTAPEDGDYWIRVEHLFRQAKGGPQYTYRLQVEKDPLPDFRLVCVPTHDIHIDTHLLFQDGRERFDILIWRLNGHNEPITIEARNLPPGVTADPVIAGPGVKWASLVLTASADAPPSEQPIEIVGTSKVREQNLVRKARGGVIVWDTVNTPALARMTQTICMAVREKVAFTVSMEPQEITVEKGKPFEVTVTARRRADMPSAIQINDAGFQLPPGLDIPVTNIESGQTQAKLTLKSEKMPEGTFSFIVMGEAQVPIKDRGNVRCFYPSNSVKITVTAPPKK